MEREGEMSEGKGREVGSVVHASPHATLLTFRLSLPIAAPKFPQSFSTQHHPIKHLSKAFPCAQIFPPFRFYFSYFNFYYSFFFIIFLPFRHRGGSDRRLQESARLFVGPPVPRSLPLLLFQQSQYLAWIRGMSPAGL